MIPPRVVARLVDAQPPGHSQHGPTLVRWDASGRARRGQEIPRRGGICAAWE